MRTCGWLGLLAAAAAAAAAAGGHECIHESVARHPSTQVRVAPQLYGGGGKNPGGTRQGEDGGGDEGGGGGGDGGRRMLRVRFETHGLDDDEKTCYSEGDRVEAEGVDVDCTAPLVVTEERREYLRTQVLPAASKWFARALATDSVSGSLMLLDIPCGFDGGVDPTPFSDGTSNGATRSGSFAEFTNADLVIFVTARPVPTSPGTIAWAVACQTDGRGRAVAGQINFAPNHIPDVDAPGGDYIGVAVHEIAHVLGISSNSFENFVDDNGNGLLTSDVIGVTDSWYPGYNLNVIKTPTVRSVVREHFGCDELEGGELEGGGESGTAGSHWEKRLFDNEFMTGTASSSPVFSALSLALLQDTGWYTANFDMAQPLAFGRGQGCAFATGPCDEWSGQGYECVSPASTDGCSPDGMFTGSCSSRRYDVQCLPAPLQWFPDCQLGGLDSLADYCPKVVSSASCQSPSTDDGPFGQVAGTLSSRCFASTPTGTTNVQANCHRLNCTSDGGLVVEAAGEWITCPAEGGIVSAANGQMELLCPEPGFYCADWCESGCSGNGRCSRGQCVCSPGFVGDDCERADTGCINDCSDRGECVNGLCECPGTWAGVDCSYKDDTRTLVEKFWESITGGGVPTIIFASIGAAILFVCGASCLRNKQRERKARQHAREMGQL